MAIKTQKVEVPDKKFENPEENKTLEIYREQHPIDPRTHDSIGIMECSHGRYRLGDKQIDTDKFNGWHEIKQHIKDNHEVKAILPIYMLDHSIQTVSTTPFNNKWDSGQVGYIYTTQKKLEKLGIKPEHRDDTEKLEKWLRDEVEEYDNYLRGEQYRFRLLEEGEEIDACGMFNGLDIEQIFHSAGENRDNYNLVEEN